ncbi:MAG: hypothetical protein Q4G59_03375 [Planctomycetia bacterium]|nr:hypothetical protein [Planctomycetia bacterium]
MMKRSVVLLVIFALSLMCGVNSSYAGNLTCGVYVSPYAKQLYEFETQISRIDEKIAKLNEVLEESSDNKVAQALKKALLEERAKLVAAHELVQGLLDAHEQLVEQSLTGKSYIFDAPQGTQRTSVDRQANDFGKKVAKDFEADKTKTIISLLNLEKAVEDLLNKECYKNVSKRDKTECTKLVAMVKDKLIEMFSKGMTEMKMEYVGIRKSLRGHDWMVFRLSSQVGDLSYWMVSYTSDENKSFRSGKLFIPAAGDYAEGLMLPPFVKLLDTKAGIPNTTYSIPASQGESLTKALINGDGKTIVKFFDEHPEHLWKNKVYDGNYVNALQMTYAEDPNEELGKKLKIAVEQFRKHYPDNILPDISLLSLFLDKGDEEESIMGCLNHIREAVIDDPLLWWFESMFSAVHGNFDKALSCAKKAGEKGYSDIEAYKLLLELFKQKNASPEKIKAMEDIIDKLDRSGIGNAKPEFSSKG